MRIDLPRRHARLIVVIIFSATVPWLLVHAQTPGARWNNDTLHRDSHPRPLNVDIGLGYAVVTMEDGSTMTGREVFAEPVPIMRFEWQDAFWWTDGETVVYGTNSVGMEPQADTDQEAMARFYSSW